MRDASSDASKWFQKELDSVRDTFEFGFEEVLFDVAENISKLMEDQKMNRSQLAQRLEVSRAYVTKLLNGNPNLTLKTLYKLADVFERGLSIQFPSKLSVQSATTLQNEGGGLEVLTCRSYEPMKLAAPSEERDDLPVAA